LTQPPHSNFLLFSLFTLLLKKREQGATAKEAIPFKNPFFAHHSLLSNFNNKEQPPPIKQQHCPLIHCSLLITFLSSLFPYYVFYLVNLHDVSLHTIEPSLCRTAFIAKISFVHSSGINIFIAVIELKLNLGKLFLIIAAKTRSKSLS